MPDSAPTGVLDLKTAIWPVTITPWNDAAVTYLPRTRKWQLKHDLRAFDEVKRCELIVHAGFLYDLSSIRPRIIWPFIAPFELGTAPPAAHDALFQSGGNASEWLTMKYEDEGNCELEVIYTRAEADRLFNQMMKAIFVIEWKRRIAYRVVRLLGGFYWKGEAAASAITTTVRGVGP